MPGTQRVIPAVALLAAILTASACNTADPAAEQTATSASASAATAVSTDPGSGEQVLFTGIQVTRSDGHDTVIWEFAGPGLPGWRVGYTDDPRREGSGEPVDLPGEATLAVLITGVGIPGDVAVPEGTQPYDTRTVVEVGAG